MPSSIFLSHNHADKAFVRRLAQDLSKAGVRIWLDEAEMMIGDSLIEKIRNGIDEMEYLGVILSQNSVQSTWVNREVEIAMNQEIEGKRVKVLPLVVDDCELPGFLKGKLYADFRAPDHYNDELAKVLRRLGVTETLRDGDGLWCPELVVIPPGRFLMGSPIKEEGRYSDEGPQRRMTIGRRFAIGRYPVTFAEYDHFCDAMKRKKPDDAGWGRGKRPVIFVRFRDATDYCDWLAKETGQLYRLPSEAEWEYACRAGTTTRYSYGNEITEDKANFGRKRGRTTEVGVYPANAFGIHDMHGNVFEWVLDEWDGDYSDAPSHGRANTTNNKPNRHVLRGSSWYGTPRSLRSAARYWRSPSAATNKIGFRVCREVR